jgi:uncharacterized protein
MIMKKELDNALNWFEIPVADLNRAIKFYERVLSKPLRQEAMGPVQMAVFSYDQKGVGGALMKAPEMTPHRDGAIVYLNAAPSIDATLARIADAGGSVALPKTALPEGMGFFAHMIDTEGNRVGIHAMA